MTAAPFLSPTLRFFLGASSSDEGSAEAVSDSETGGEEAADAEASSSSYPDASSSISEAGSDVVES